LGQFAEKNFYEVTADTFEFLIQETAQLQNEIREQGGSVRYLAYGYHGTEVLIGKTIQWQAYAPYVQGWAKVKLEEIAKAAWKAGSHATVYNCPEILTNSSSIFQGVELPLYPFLGALQRVNTPRVKQVLDQCKVLLKPEHSFEEIQKYTAEFLSSRIIREHCQFDLWPQHNSKEQMEKMIASSEHLIAMHKNEKALMTAVLSEEVFKSTGYIMFHDSFKPQAPVLWLGHDILAKASAKI
jgi:hypothetical protein